MVQLVEVMAVTLELPALSVSEVPPSPLTVRSPKVTLPVLPTKLPPTKVRIPVLGS